MQKNILSNLMNNTINWNNTTLNLLGQSNEKVLQLTKRHVVLVLKQLDLLGNTLKNVKKVEMYSMYSNTSCQFLS